MGHQNINYISAKNPPIVELDSEARAAYVRFSLKRVRETKVVMEDKCIVTIDLDAEGEIVGVESCDVYSRWCLFLLRWIVMEAFEGVIQL